MMMSSKSLAVSLTPDLGRNYTPQNKMACNRYLICPEMPGAASWPGKALLAGS